MKIKIKRLHPLAQIPTYATQGSSGLDLVAPIHHDVPAGGRRLVPLGFSLELPPGWEAQVRSRSGLAWRHGVVVLNSPGTVDSDYRGEVCVLLHNTAKATYRVLAGDRIAQLVIAPVVQAEIEEAGELSETERGGNGFGSTGQ